MASDKFLLASGFSVVRGAVVEDGMTDSLFSEVSAMSLEIRRRQGHKWR